MVRNGGRPRCRRWNSANGGVRDRPGIPALLLVLDGGKNLDDKFDTPDPDLDSSSSSNNNNLLWMNLPTFKTYLRRKAKLQLLVLGPEWVDTVKGESDWRLGLYES